MSSLKADFDELRERIRHGRELGHASFEPIYYLIFGPKHILEVKRQTPAWVARLHQEGWDVHTFSIAEQIWTLLKNDPFWSLCVMEDKSAPSKAGSRASFRYRRFFCTPASEPARHA